MTKPADVHVLQQADRVAVRAGRRRVRLQPAATEGGARVSDGLRPAEPAARPVPADRRPAAAAARPAARPAARGGTPAAGTAGAGGGAPAGTAAGGGGGVAGGGRRVAPGGGGGRRRAGRRPDGAADEHHPELREAGDAGAAVGRGADAGGEPQAAAARVLER